MPENARLNGGLDDIDVDFVGREATPRLLMKLSIQLHLAGLSLSNTVAILEMFGVERARSTVHNWVHKADLPEDLGHFAQQIKRHAVRFLEVNPQTVQRYDCVVGESAATVRGGRFASPTNSVLSRRHRLCREAGDLRQRISTVSRFISFDLAIHSASVW